MFIAQLIDIHGNTDQDANGTAVLFTTIQETREACHAAILEALRDVTENDQVRCLYDVVWCINKNGIDLWDIGPKQLARLMYEQPYTPVLHVFEVKIGNVDYNTVEEVL